MAGPRNSYQPSYGSVAIDAETARRDGQVFFFKRTGSAWLGEMTGLHFEHRFATGSRFSRPVKRVPHYKQLLNLHVQLDQSKSLTSLKPARKTSV